MRAVQHVAAGDPRYGEHDDPTPGPGEAVVRIETVATCPQWDLHIMNDDPMFVGHRFDFPYPVGQPGHEAAGVVVAVGKGVTELRPGMRVAAWRDAGQTRPGCYAELNAFDADGLLPIPNELSFREATSLELAMCVQVSFDRLLAAGLVEGRRVAIAGLGPAGLVAVQMAGAYGASEVVAIEPNRARHVLGTELGAARVVGPDDPWARNLSRSDDGAFDIAVDCTGFKTSIEFLMDRTRTAVSIFGVLRETISYEPRHWSNLALIGYGSHNKAAARRALKLIASGTVRLEPLLTETMPLSEYRRGIELLRRREAIKVCFEP
jgi:threonine dehydrogenase-like Zn-dependent dehydrogenase